MIRKKNVYQAIEKKSKNALDYSADQLSDNIEEISNDDKTY